MPLLAGTSGWQYRDWRDAFYPPGLPLSHWLDHYAETFPTVENNGTFYRLAKPETFAGWRARTPDGFLMAVKASRYLTHIRRLRDPAEPVGRLLAACAGLGDRLGPVLLQLPPTMQADPGALDQCLREFAAQAAATPGLRERALRVCVEFRHESWLPRRTSGNCSRGTTRRCAGRIAAGARSARSGRPPTGVTCGCTRAPPARGRGTVARRSRPG